MRRALVIFIILALAIPRFILPASAATSHSYPTLSYVSHDITVDPEVYHSVGNVYIVEFETMHAKDMFVQMVKSKAIVLPPGVKFLHAYKYMPFVLLGGDAKVVVEYVKHIPGTTAIRANKKFYLERNLNPENPVPKNLGNVLKLGAQTFRNAGYTGMGIVIAIIDTGIRKDHPEFNYDNGTCKVLYEESFVLTIYGYDYNETNPDDGVGHGTMVAGAAAGLGKQPDGQGVAPDAALVNLKVFPAGENTYATSAGIIAAIDRAIELKTSGQVDINIINMSLGGSPGIHFDPEIAAVRIATEHGIAVVIAAGNEGDNGRASGYVSAPGIAPLAITAGAAYNRNATVEGYSSPGPTPRLGVKPDVMAPGTGSYPCPPFVSDYLYRAASGTSFATPHISGSVALLLQYIYAHDPNVDAVAAIGYAKATLMKSAVHIIKDAKTNVTFDELRTGAGFVNLTAAYEILSANPEPGFVYVLPTHLPIGITFNGSYPIVGPFFPASVFYTGQEITVNFTLTSGVAYDVHVVLTGDLVNALNVTSETSFTMEIPTTTYTFRAIITAGAGTYTGSIDFVAANGTVLFEVPVVLDVVGEPVAKILRDLHHTDRGVDTPYGQFSLFAIALQEAGIAIDVLDPAEDFTLDAVQGYDRIFTGDFASGVSLSADDAKTFIEYIQNGGHVIAIVMDTIYYDVDSIGRLSYAFGISFGSNLISSGNNPVLASRNSSLPFGISGKMPMYGIPVVPMNPGVLELATYMNFVVAAAAPTINGGALVVFGTNFLFDNRAMTDQYGVSHTAIVQSVLNIITFNFASVFVGYTVSISGDLTLGGTVNVQTTIPAMKVVHSDRVSSEEVSNSFTVERAGPNSVGISFAYGNYPFGLVIPLRIEPSEYNAPVMSNPVQTLYTSSSKNLTIPVVITDETGVETNKYEVAVFVIKKTGPMSVQPAMVFFTGTETNVTLNIVFTPDQFTIVFGASNSAHIVVLVKTFDKNYNYDTKTLEYDAVINNAPKLDVTYSTEAGTIHLKIKVSDDDSKDNLVVYLDGEVVYNETVNVGEEISVDISAEAGSHNVTVVATDPAGNVAKRSETIEVPKSGISTTTIAVIAAIIVIIIIALAYFFLTKKKA